MPLEMIAMVLHKPMPLSQARGAQAGDILDSKDGSEWYGQTTENSWHNSGIPGQSLLDILSQDLTLIALDTFASNGILGPVSSTPSCLCVTVGHTECKRQH